MPNAPESPEDEFKRLMWPLIATYTPFGCWPDRAELEGARDLRSNLRRCHRYLAIVLLFLVASTGFLEVLHFWGEDMNDTIECSLVASALNMALFRVIVFTDKQKDMLYVVETMRRDWLYSGPEERQLLRDKCLLPFKLAKIFTMSVMFAGSAFVVMPYLEIKLHPEEHKKVMPFRGYYFFNNTESPVYEYTYFLNAVIGAMGCSTIAAGTGFSLITTMHGAAKFTIVQQDFKAIDSEGWLDNEKIGKCVQRHQESIRFAEKVEEIINFLALAQFIISTGLLCFAGFQMTTMMEDRARLTKYGSFLNSAIMELFIFSYSGHNLKTESEDVADFVYSSNWIGSFSSSNIQLVVTRARKPCTITAGKFYDMSLESFLKVMSSSFSYFTVLLAMEEE